MYGVRVNVAFVVRKIDRVRVVFFKWGTGTGTEKFCAKIMVRNKERVRECSEKPSTGTEFTT